MSIRRSAISFLLLITAIFYLLWSAILPVGASGLGSGAIINGLGTGGTPVAQTICDASAAVAVTAASTTQIVALTASQSVRVCSFSLSMSAAGTAKWVQGTGTNCGTGQADLTGAYTLALGTPLTASASHGLTFATTASNALCLTAVTGNVAGVVAYAKY